MIRVYWFQAGQHVHCRIFSGENQAYGYCGRLTFRSEEFMSLLYGTEELKAKHNLGLNVEFINDSQAMPMD